MKYLKRVFLGVTLIFLISLFFVFNSSSRVMDKAMGDVNGDGNYEKIELTKRPFMKYGNEVIIYSFEGTEVFREDLSELKPWKLAVGDVDGDGIDDISIGVFKKTLFHPVMAKRPFIYSFKDGNLFPKWRGSRLSKPFTDYIFCDIDGDSVNELVSIEILNNDEKCINTYKWKGFGFEGLAQSRSYEDIFNIYLEEGLVYIEYKDDGKRLKGVLNYKEEITIERVIGDEQ